MWDIIFNKEAARACDTEPDKTTERRNYMFKLIAIAVVVLAAAVLIFAATRPDLFHVKRAIAIKAPPEKVFAFINDLHRWRDWSPFERRDPAMKISFNGAGSGKGAKYEWSGNDKAGKGSIEIVESLPTAKVAMKLELQKPIEAHNIVEFTLKANGDSTNVTWAMSGSRCPFTVSRSVRPSRSQSKKKAPNFIGPRLDAVKPHAAA